MKVSYKYKLWLNYNPFCRLLHQLAQLIEYLPVDRFEEEGAIRAVLKRVHQVRW